MSGVPQAWRAAAVYLAAAVALSWPLAVHADRSIAGDLGDPLLNAWILAWGSEHATAVAGGDWGAFGRWWHANIFHPSPLALAYSEHLAPQVLMGLPVWWLTGNILLVYNALFLASSVLSGLGTFLLVRELTGRPRAALVAGLCFAFVPYRVAQLPHLQVLWSQWMPFALYGFRCYLDRGRTRALAGGLAALIAQQLSCGYYLLYFSPFVALYLAWEITVRRRWTDLRLLGSLAAAAAVDVAVTWPFLEPYMRLRASGFAPRPLAEVAQYSADVAAYVTAHPANRVWGAWLEGVARPENELFPGLVPIALALGGLGALARHRWIASAGTAAPRGPRRWLAPLFLSVSAAGLVLVTALALTGGLVVRLAGATLLRVSDFDRPLVLTLTGLAATLAVSGRARRFCAWGTDLRVCALLLLVAAVVLSWGPSPRSWGRPLGFDGPYLWLYGHVPGFDGLRVPARMAMVAYLFLAILAGHGLAVIEGWRRGAWWLALLGLLVLVEGAGVPLHLDRPIGDPGVAAPPPRVYPAWQAPRVYRQLAELPDDTVVAELPFGYASWELRYVFYSSVHLHRLANGYSGGFPDQYVRRAAALMRPLDRPEDAWLALTSAGVTHLVVHTGAYERDERAALARWLEGRGARRLGTFDGDDLFALPR